MDVTNRTTQGLFITGFGVIEPGGSATVPDDHPDVAELLERGCLEAAEPTTDKAKRPKKEAT